MFRTIQMEAIAQMLKTLPVPITITQHLDEQREKIFYRYQAGETPPENPVGIRMAATPNFLDTVKFSLQAVLNEKEGEPQSPKTRKPWQPCQPSPADHL